MNKKPLVSIIMNCFNGEEYLDEAINSIFSQDYDNWELIFWDNQSTDRSAEIVKQYQDSRIQYHYATIHTSLGDARELALKHAKGKYIGFLDCDDVYLSGKLTKQISAMDRYCYNFSYGSSKIIDNFGNTTGMFEARNKSGFILKELLLKYEINMASVIFEKNLLREKWFTFGEKITYSPDYFLFMKVAAKYPIMVFQEPLTKYRIHDKSLSRKRLHIVAEEHSRALKDLKECFPYIEHAYFKEFRFAVQKSIYYEAIYLISINKYNQAKKILKKLIFYDLKYFTLYILLQFFVPNKFLMKILKR
jgi:glycosyltransferase involved in cell wall biosynthesis